MAKKCKRGMIDATTCKGNVANMETLLSIREKPWLCYRA